MKRKIIKIEEELCTGCGDCIPNCPEGALQIIDGKCRLVSDLFCDGLGACIKNCPFNAIHVEEREAEPYNESIVMDTIVKQGENTIKAHLNHLKVHNANDLYKEAIEYLKTHKISIPSGHYIISELPTAGCKLGGCPGTQVQTMNEPQKDEKFTQNIGVEKQKSELHNWPIQLNLLTPRAPFLKHADLLIAADCTAFSYPNFHADFVKDHILVMGCPKLDDAEGYIEKFTEIFKTQEISSLTILMMEVPCCSGLNRIIEISMQNAGVHLPTKRIILGIDGSLKRSG